MHTTQSKHIDFDYAPSIESTDVVKIKSENQLFIDGKFVNSSNAKYFPTVKPANG